MRNNPQSNLGDVMESLVKKTVPVTAKLPWLQSGFPGDVSGCGCDRIFDQSLDFGDLLLRECVGISALLNGKTSGR